MEGLCDPCSEQYIDSGTNLDGTLIIAAWKGHVNCVRTLVHAGADVNNTALTSAVITGRDECVNLLIELGADVNKQGNILEKAAAYGRDKCVELLLQHISYVSEARLNESLMRAVESNQSKCVNVLLKAGADVNTQDEIENRHTVLMIAAKYGSIECVDALLHAGALVNVSNDYHNIALAQYIVWSGYMKPNRKLCMLLFAAGETVEVTSDGCLKRVWVPRWPPRKYEAPWRRYLVPEYLINTKAGLCLKEKCREAIRNHLLELDRNENLFIRVPKLDLPTPLTKYLLYGY